MVGVRRWALVLVAALVVQLGAVGVAAGQTVSYGPTTFGWPAAPCAPVVTLEAAYVPQQSTTLGERIQMTVRLVTYDAGACPNGPPTMLAGFVNKDGALEGGGINFGTSKDGLFIFDPAVPARVGPYEHAPDPAYWGIRPYNGSTWDVRDERLIGPYSKSPPVAPAPAACADGQVQKEEAPAFGGYGGGGDWGTSWGTGAGSGSVSGDRSWGFAFWWDGQTYRRFIESEANTLASGWGGYGGGGDWGTSSGSSSGESAWILACDQDGDGQPDPPAGAESGTTAKPATYVQAPPAPAPTAPTAKAGCDFGVTSPSSWLCGLGGLWQGIADALGRILAFLAGLPGLFLRLFVPAPGFTEGKVAGIRDQWRGSGPGAYLDAFSGLSVAVGDVGAQAAGCKGPRLAAAPGGYQIELHPLNACPGTVLGRVAPVVRVLLLIGLYLGGAIVAARVLAGSFGLQLPAFGERAQT